MHKKNRARKKIMVSMFLKVRESTEHIVSSSSMVTIVTTFAIENFSVICEVWFDEPLGNAIVKLTTLLAVRVI